MDVVLDSNILFRILISQGNILGLVFDNQLKIYAPNKLKIEFLKNKDEIIEKSKLSKKDFEDLASLIFQRIKFIDEIEYSHHLIEAKNLLKEHEKDIEFVALSLLKKIKIWTYESLLFKIERGVSTKEIALSLNSNDI